MVYFGHDILYLPHLLVLIAEIDQAGNVEKQFNKVVQHQQNQTQAI